MSDGDNDNSGPSNYFSEELIALVKLCPCLYDRNDTNFKNNVTKDECWDFICKALKERSPWKFQRDCDFLRDHVAVKKPPATVNNIGKVVNYKTRMRNIDDCVKTITEELRELNGTDFEYTQFKIIKQIVSAQKTPDEPQKEPEHESE